MANIGKNVLKFTFTFKANVPRLYVNKLIYEALNNIICDHIQLKANIYKNLKQCYGCHF
jgi:hypothetical protein